MREEVLLDADVLDDARLSAHAELVLLQKVTQASTVDEIDRRCAVPRGLCFGVSGECTGGNQQTFVSSAGHRSAEVAYGTRPDAALVPLALEEDWERNQRHPVDS